MADQPLALSVQLQVALATAGDAAREAVAVMVRDRTYAAGQAALSEGLRRHGVPGWHRVTNPGCCPMCTDKAHAEYLPSATTMWRHKGCSCHPDPVLTEVPRGD